MITDTQLKFLKQHDATKLSNLEVVILKVLVDVVSSSNVLEVGDLLTIAKARYCPGTNEEYSQAIASLRYFNLIRRRLEASALNPRVRYETTDLGRQALAELLF